MSKTLAPKFSVIIPTYNRKQTLSRAIESVLQQSYTDFELIVVDDGSTDETSTFVRKNYPQVRLFTGENLGVSHARNFAAKNANGEYLAFLDSDDQWLPLKLAEQAQYLEQYPLTNLLHCDEIWIRNGKRVNPMKKHQKQGGDFFDRALELCLISPSAVVIKKDFFDRHNGFDESFIVCEDYDLWLRMKVDPEVGHIGYLETALLQKYGGHDDQLSRKFFAMDIWRIRSIARLILEYPLSLEQKNLCLDVFEKKSKILLHGYAKHGHEDKVLEVQALINSLKGER